MVRCSRLEVRTLLRHRVACARENFEVTDSALIRILENLNGNPEQDLLLTGAQFARWQAVEIMSRSLEQFSDMILYGFIPDEFASEVQFPTD